MGWALIILRGMAMALLFMICLPFYYLWRLLALPRFWPRVFLGGVGKIVGLRLTIRGQPRHNALYIANHVSWLDIPAIAWACGSAFVGHDGLAQSRVFRHLCEMNDTVFIARHRRASVGAQAVQIRHALDDIGALTLFPEGTTSDGTGLLPFKSALLAAIDPLPEGVAVQPVLLKYGEVPNIAWVGDEPGFNNFTRIMGRWRAVELTLHFLEPLSGEALTNRKSMAAAAQASVAVALAQA